MKKYEMLLLVSAVRIHLLDRKFESRLSPRQSPFDVAGVVCMLNAHMDIWVWDV